jgi:aryl-alcohol dehydrogenase-like predicted oxidoreductase
MQYARLGRTALKVSRLCLGTMNFGWVNSDVRMQINRGGMLERLVLQICGQTYLPISRSASP